MIKVKRVNSYLLPAFSKYQLREDLKVGYEFGLHYWLQEGGLDLNVAHKWRRKYKSSPPNYNPLWSLSPYTDTVTLITFLIDPAQGQCQQVDPQGF